MAERAAQASQRQQVMLMSNLMSAEASARAARAGARGLAAPHLQPLLGPHPGTSHTGPYPYTDRIIPVTEEEEQARRDELYEELNPRAFARRPLGVQTSRHVPVHLACQVLGVGALVLVFYSFVADLLLFDRFHNILHIFQLVRPLLATNMFLVVC